MTHCWLRLKPHDWQPAKYPLQYQCERCNRYRHKFEKLPF